MLESLLSMPSGMMHLLEMQVEGLGPKEISQWED